MPLKFSILFLALVTSVLAQPALGAPTGRSGLGYGIVISATTSPVAGTQWCFTVAPTAGESSISVNVMVAGQRLTPTISLNPNGTFLVCVTIPANAVGKPASVSVSGPGPEHPKHHQAVVQPQP